MGRKDLTSTLVYLPDQRDVELSPYGLSNAKLGPNVYTYSLPAGKDHSCPGSTSLCEEFCYAKRIGGVVGYIHRENLKRGPEGLPEIPLDCELLRIHVSGDFYSEAYVRAWIHRLRARRHEVQGNGPAVRAFAYTRSWRVPELLESLTQLRDLSNMQLFASVDDETGPAPAGWRVAHIREDFDELEYSHQIGDRNSYSCGEATKHFPNCEECEYCFIGHRNDVTFPKH